MLAGSAFFIRIGDHRYRLIEFFYLIKALTGHQGNPLVLRALEDLKAQLQGFTIILGQLQPPHLADFFLHCVCRRILGQCQFDVFDQIIFAERFYQKTVSSFLYGIKHLVGSPLIRDHHDGYGIKLGIAFDVLEQFYPGHVRHIPVRDHQVDRLLGDMLQGLLTALCNVQIDITVLSQHHPKHIAHLRQIVHREQAFIVSPLKRLRRAFINRHRYST